MPSSVRLILQGARDFARNRFYLPSHLGVGVEDFVDIIAPPESVQDNEPHVQAAMTWLARAQDATPDGGVSARYRLDRGWTPSYPETTGYIIPTLLEYSCKTGTQEWRERARHMAEWLLSIQLPSGAFSGHDVSSRPKPVVFNTGQILYGLICAYQVFRSPEFLGAACKAGDWLVSVQDEDGAWRKCTYLNRPHSYHTRVAWPLLMLWSQTGNGKYLNAAVRNLDWALSNVTDNGWIAANGFRDNDNPYLHTIAYAASGFLESAIILKQLGQPSSSFEKYLHAAQQTAAAVMHRWEVRRYPYAQYDRNWKSTVRFSCLTGNSQIAIIWMRLFQLFEDPRFLNAAIKINEFVKRTQNLASSNPGIRGGIKGSHPLWGQYIRLSYPNWSAKFFVDALLMEDNLLTTLYRAAGL